MKIRTGFVSNSSSSSFCIYGIALEERVDLSFLPAGRYGDHEIEGLEILKYSDYGVYIGRSWSDVKDDETGAMFKKSIEEKLKEVFKGKIELPACRTHSEAWYDG
jgi:hypothetical protein